METGGLIICPIDELVSCHPVEVDCSDQYRDGALTIQDRLTVGLEPLKLSIVVRIHVRHLVLGSIEPTPVGVDQWERRVLRSGFDSRWY